MLYIGKLNTEIYRCVIPDIVTDEVIITDERIRHIQARHPDDYECFAGYLAEIITDPDYIIRDERFATALVLKTIKTGEHWFRLSLRLVTSSDDPDFKNSVLTFLRIREKEWNRLIHNKEILYTRE